jgi:hypothetical protein
MMNRTRISTRLLAMSVAFGDIACITDTDNSTVKHVINIDLPIKS